MKKKHFFLPFAAALILSGCSSDEPNNNGGGNGNDEGGTPSYLTINLVTTSSAGRSRVAGDPTVEGEKAEYEAGLETENSISKVRFYFFDKNGKPAFVKKVGNTKQNYIDWEKISVEGDKMPNIEKVLNAMLIINTQQGDETPDKVVAIINPDGVDGLVTNVSLGNIVGVNETSINSFAGDYTKHSNGDFIMSNATYNNNGAQMAVSVANNLYPTAGEAQNDPAQIYVERTIAKVRLNSSLTKVEGKDYYKTSSATKNQTVNLTGEEGGEQEIFVKFLGWNTTAVTDKSRLIKEINTGWADNILGAQPWNWSDYHRSFWAINATDLGYQYGAFQSNTEADNLFQAQAKTKFDKTEYVYINENASDISDTEGTKPATPTKVIIAAQLVDKDGNALEFAEYGSTRCSVAGLMDLFATNCGLYSKTVADGKTTFSKIKTENLKIVTTADLDPTATTKRYKVYVQLAVDQDNVWYPSNNENAEALTAEEANDILMALGSAKVWKDGYTYYYFDIAHLDGKPGVVRNHIYDANISTLSGLGTPVYDPDEIIYPEKPDNDKDTFLAAKINVLSWRIVNSDTNLNWD